ncbi:MAG: TrmH family RNA methyltransferase [Nocardioidaceae bacterium]
MARLIEVDNPRDPRLADYVDLRDTQLRRSLEAEHGLFIAEGEKVVRRAVEAGHGVRSFVMAPRWLSGLSDVLDRAGDAPCYVVDESVAEQVTGFHVHRGALASLQRRPLRTADEVLTGARTVVVLEDIVDHTNVGAIFRTAAAFGVDAVLLSPRCADPLYRRAVKVGMGAVFRMPYARMDRWYDGLAHLRTQGFSVVALTPAADAVPLDEAVQSPRVALVLGSEGHGLTHRWLTSSDERARIPMGAEVDSLNVAAAAAVACYILTQRRPPGRSPR